MTIVNRGIQLYLVGLVFVALMTVVWGTNRFLFSHTLTETGWSLLVGIAVLLLLLGVGGRRLVATPTDESPSREYPWSSRDDRE